MILKHKIRTFASALMAATVLVATPALAEKTATSGGVWDLTDLYATDTTWQQAYGAAKARVEGLDQYKTTFDRSPQDMLNALTAISYARKELARVSVYASLKADEDTRIQANLARKSLTEQAWTIYAENTSWLAPLVMDMGEAKIERFLTAEAGLQRHAFGLRNILRMAPHTLDADAEALIAAAGDVRGGPERIYNQLSNSDMPWPTIRFSTGETVKLNQSAYVKWRRAENRADRKRTFDAFWGRWGDFESSMGEALKAHIQSQAFEAKARNHDSSLDMRLTGYNLPRAVYETLVSETNRTLPTLHRYLKMRGRMLGIKDLGYHDIYVDLVKGTKTYDIPTSKALTYAATQKLGMEYQQAISLGFAGQWMHVRPQDGKRSGAYMSGAAYDVHPYILLNHQDDYNSLSTFAHEWGHAVHSILSNKAQPYETAGYSIFVAETAAIINEVLLVEHMIETAKTPQDKLFYLNAALEMLRGTFYRQVLFAQFEQTAYDMVESGQAVTGSAFSDAYLKLLRQYHGEAEGVMTIDPDYAVEWAYVPHFYYNYYVYQYATSIAGSVVLADQLIAGDATARDRIIAALKKGGAEHPYDILKTAGVDLATPAPYQAIADRMNRLLDQMEDVLDTLD